MDALESFAGFGAQEESKLGVKFRFGLRKF